MPCNDGQEEWERKQGINLTRETWTAEGRWDLLATKQQVAAWLCDTLRGTPPTPELLRWWEAHKKWVDGGY